MNHVPGCAKPFLKGRPGHRRCRRGLFCLARFAPFAAAAQGGGWVHAAAAVLEGWLTPSPDASAVAIRPCLHVVINQSTCGHAVLEYDIPRWDFSFLRRK